MLAVKLAIDENERNQCFAIRHTVFVEEQNVPPDLELDEYDPQTAIHFLGEVDDQAVAAARICIFGDMAKIQRVAVLKSARGQGYGRDIMNAMIAHVESQELAPRIALNAQSYTKPFYSALGFVAEGDEFMDAGIPHVYMERPAVSRS